VTRNLVSVTGVDIEGSPVASARIVTLPTLAGAQLLRVNSDFSAGTAYATGDSVALSPNGVPQVYYSPGPVQPSDSGRDVLGVDSFSFTVTDETGLEGVVGNATILVRNSLQATSSVAETLEDTAVTVVCGASDATGSAALRVRLLAPPTVGALRQFGANSTISVFPANLTDAHGRVVYVPPLDAHGLPSVNDYALASIVFEVQSLVTGFRSANATLTLRVLPVNDAPLLTLVGASPVPATSSADPNVATPFVVEMTDVDTFPALNLTVYEVEVDPTTPLSVSVDNALLLDLAVELLVGDGNRDGLLQFRAPFGIAQAVLRTLRLHSSFNGLIPVKITVTDMSPVGTASAELRVDFLITQSAETAVATSASRGYAVLVGLIGGPIACCVLCALAVRARYASENRRLRTALRVAETRAG
jgi:hypothetical protein